MKAPFIRCIGVSLVFMAQFDFAAGYSATLGCAIRAASPFVLNVRDKGATGDGQAEDTNAIQSAIDEVAKRGGTVLVPNGTYMVNAVGDTRLSLKSNVALKLADGAVLKAIPNDAEKYSVLRISKVSNVAVIGGTLEGDRYEHSGKTGEWGMGIWIG